MWPCAIGSREETATSACYIHGKGRTLFLCRVILNAAGFFAGNASAVCRCSYNSTSGLPLIGDHKTASRAPFALLSKKAGSEGAARFGDNQGAIRSTFRDLTSGTAEVSPAISLPIGQGMFCSPWTAFEPKP